MRLARIGRADRVLDLACGTGDILFEALRYHPARAVGLDLTFRMIQLAEYRWRDRDADPALPDSPSDARPASDNFEASVLQPGFLVGDMLALPFGAGGFDVVTTGYGLRNVPHLQVAIREIHRVLVPGGRLLSLDFNRPGNRALRAAYLTYLTVVGSLLGLALHRDPDTYRYIPESIRSYPGAEGVARLLEAEGFEEVRVIYVLFGLMAIHVARKTSTNSAF